MSQGSWTERELRRRGWSVELIAQLLPKPGSFCRNGSRIRYWRRRDVLAAESDPRFVRLLSRRAVMLNDVWEAADASDDPAHRLALRCHEALIHYPAQPDHSLNDVQANGLARQLLARKQHFDGKKLPLYLTQLLRLSFWMREQPSSALGKQLLAQYPALLHTLAQSALSDFTAAQPEADAEAFLQAEGFPAAMLLTQDLAGVYAVWYVPQAIRTSLSALISLHPKNEYPSARAMRRRFVIHVGGTNTGKTYAGLQRLRSARTGIYLGPLRLLALEAQEYLLREGVRCSLTTGEEEDCREDDTHVAATAEKLPIGQVFDAAVIDECQMISDPKRGWAWTRAILGIRCPEIHLCAAPEALPLLRRLIASCGDSCFVEQHRRKTPLICMSHTVDYTQVRPGDALITFSKVGVLSVAEELRQAGKEPAIIYGALPYSTRRRQMEGFLDGRMQYVVSTDAIGMGLNLPIRRVIFMETEKFDGFERRELRPEEVQQIAGRAGRYGMYGKGYVGATQELDFVRTAMSTPIPPLTTAVTGFPELVLQVDFDLLEVLTQWSKMPTPEPYVRLDVSRYIKLISKLREAGFALSKQQELRAANIPFDENEPALMELFFLFLHLTVQGQTPERPAMPPESVRTLPELELYCRKLDLYFSFCRAFDQPFDDEQLYDCREQAAEEINEILLHRLKNNIRFCDLCGSPLPSGRRGRLCPSCEKRTLRKRLT